MVLAKDSAYTRRRKIAIGKHQTRRARQRWADYARLWSTPVPLSLDEAHRLTFSLSDLTVRQVRQRRWWKPWTW